jgi:hypothetical protein
MPDRKKGLFRASLKNIFRQLHPRVLPFSATSFSSRECISQNISGNLLWRVSREISAALELLSGKCDLPPMLHGIAIAFRLVAADDVGFSCHGKSSPARHFVCRLALLRPYHRQHFRPDGLALH